MLGVNSRRPLWQRATSLAPWERHVSSALWYRTLFLWPPFITMYNRQLNGHYALGITWDSYTQAVLWRPENRASLNTPRCLIKMSFKSNKQPAREKKNPVFCVFSAGFDSTAETRAVSKPRALAAHRKNNMAEVSTFVSTYVTWSLRA